MRSMIRTVVCAILILFLGLQLPAQAQFFLFENPLIGKEAPDFTLKMLNSGTVSMSKYRDGHKAIMFFWATWCPHCRVALADLNSRRSEFKKNGIKLIIIDINEEEEQVRSYTDRHNIAFDVFLDTKSSLSGPYMIVGVPTFVLVDNVGIVKSVEHSLPINYAVILSQ